MQRIRLLSVGQIKTSWISQGCDVHVSRLEHACDFEQIVLQADTPQKEEEKMLKSLEKIRGTIVLLDERGKTMTSPAFAQWIGKKRDAGEEITFVVGGAYGIGQKVKAAHTQSIRLSDMTFPHELCQLIFLEQLYRAHEILKGSGYHH